MKKSNKSQSIAKRKSDILFSQIIRSIGKCEFCGNTQTLQCAHIYSRKFGNTRTLYTNALCLCASCHRKGHDSPLEFAEKVATWAADKHINLDSLRLKAVAYGKQDWEAHFEQLKLDGQLVESGKITLEELRTSC